MFIRTYDNNIINIDNIADISLSLDDYSITARSPKAVNHNYDIFKLSYRISETTNGMGDEYFVIINPFYIEYYQAVLFSSLGETTFNVDLENGVISVPQRDLNGEYQRTITDTDDGNKIGYNFNTEYKILYDENNKPMVSVDDNTDYYVLQPTTVTVTNKDEGQYVLTPTFMTHIVNASVIKEYVQDLYSKIQEAIFENANLDLYDIINDWYDYLYTEQTIAVYDKDGNPIPSKYLLTNNKGYAVLQDNSYVYVNMKGDPIVDPETGEPVYDEDGDPEYEIVPLRVSSVEYTVV